MYRLIFLSYRKICGSLSILTNPISLIHSSDSRRGHLASEEEEKKKEQEDPQRLKNTRGLSEAAENT